jgi:FMNH2-dependent dimethyl sulfone monooxygenase
MDTKFGFWIPNMAGGFLSTNYPHETDWDWDYAKKITLLGDEGGFDYALSPARYLSSHSADHSLEANATALALGPLTEQIELISAVHTGLWHPGPLANLVTTGDRLTGGRIHLNVVTGWFQDEYTKFGEPWLEHDERYARSEEFIRCLKGLWKSGKESEPFSFNGRFYHFDKALCRPGPTGNPLIFQAGNSHAARKVAARVSDWWFLNGNYLSDAKELIDSVHEYAEEFGTEPPKIAINSFALLKNTEAEAKHLLEKIIDGAEKETLESFKEQVQEAGNASPEGEGMWDDAELEDLVQWNNGFRTGLIGTKQQIVERIRQLDAIGIDMVLTSFLNYSEDLPVFAEEIIPAVREAEPLTEKEVQGLPA